LREMTLIFIGCSQLGPNAANIDRKWMRQGLSRAALDRYVDLQAALVAKNGTKGPKSACEGAALAHSSSAP